MKELKKGDNIISVYPIEDTNYCYWELRDKYRTIITTGICLTDSLIELWG